MIGLFDVISSVDDMYRAVSYGSTVVLLGMEVATLGDKPLSCRILGSHDLDHLGRGQARISNLPCLDLGRSVTLNNCSK